VKIYIYSLVLSSLFSFTAFGFELIAPDKFDPSTTKLMYPDPTITEGDVMLDADLAKARGNLPVEIVVIPDGQPGADAFNNICRKNYTAAARNVTMEEKTFVFNLYKDIFPTALEHRGDYEIDHFVSLEFGGSNCTHKGQVIPSIQPGTLPAHTCTSANLWPQPYNPEANDLIPGAKLKDVVEDTLHEQVCSGKLDVHEAEGVIIGKNPLTGQVPMFKTGQFPNGIATPNWYSYFYYVLFEGDQAKYKQWESTNGKGEINRGGDAINKGDVDPDNVAPAAPATTDEKIKTTKKSGS
jgi:hypothetical protein